MAGRFNNLIPKDISKKLVRRAVVKLNWRNPIRPQDFQNVGSTHTTALQEWLREQQDDVDCSASPRSIDLSRLPRHLFNRLDPGAQLHTHIMQSLSKELPENVQRVKSRTLAVYGQSRAPHYDYSLSWPSAAQVREWRDFEARHETQFAQEMDNLSAARQSKAAEIDILMSNIKRRFAKHDAALEAYHARLAQKHEARAEQLKRQRKLVEEGRELYGYTMNAKDPKLARLAEHKAAEAKKKKKEELKRRRLAPV